MGIGSQIKNGGWGAAILSGYTLPILLYWDIPLVTSDRIALVAATLPALLVMFTVAVLNDELNDFWAGGNLKESTEEIAEITSGHDFYHSASAEIRETVDDFDEKAYSHHVSIISGIIISVTLPIVGHLASDWMGFIIGIVLAAISFKFLAMHGYNELNQLATDLSTPYKENYEN